MNGNHASVVYVLPRKDYFELGMRGRVAHAAGLVSGLVNHGVSVEVISGDNAEQFIKRAKIYSVDRKQAYSWLSSLKSLVAQHLNRANTPTVLLIRYGVSSGFRLMSLCALNRAHVRSCFEVNSLMYHQKSEWPNVLRDLILRIECAILKQADSVYVISRTLGEDITRGGFRGEVLIVPNGGAAAYNLSPAVLGKTLRFAFFGILQPYYDFDVILESFRLFREKGGEAELVFYGDGMQFERLSALVRNTDGIRCTGRYVINELINEQLDNDYTVLLLPLRDNDYTRVISPIKLFEYMATGLPVVAAQTSALSDFLVHNESALLATADDPLAWAHAMTLMADPAIRERLSANMRSAYKGHTWDARMQKLGEEFDRLHEGRDRHLP